MITLNGRTGISEIHIDDTSNVAQYISDKKTVVFIDKNVKRYHGNLLSGVETIELKAQESQKDLATVQQIYKLFLDLEVDRSWIIVGIGGGIISDIAGFVASTYMRGLDFGFIPTTLLSQVDASIGGKNGVNLQGYKNIIGTITQPKFVICDPALLKTLPELEIRSGFAEIIKHAMIKDNALFSLIEENADAAYALEEPIIRDIIQSSIKVKVDIVQADETEKHERIKLNFGHTIGHAIEKVKKLPHGEAVAIGMIAESKLALNNNLITENDFERLKSLLQKMKLPVNLSANKEKIIDAIKKDKKRRDEKLLIPVPTTVGDCKIINLSLDVLEANFDDLC